VYWKVPLAQVPLALQATRSLQRNLAQRHPGLMARVLQRAEAAGAGQGTVMEIYAQPGGVSAQVQEDIEAQAALHLAALGLPLPHRHVEVFEAR
jgi:hypothetical protein